MFQQRLVYDWELCDAPDPVETPAFCISVSTKSPGLNSNGLNGTYISITMNAV
jgi:hypothetical protein